MPNWLLQYDATHLIGALVFLFALVFSGILIWMLTKKYEQMEIFWVPWWLVIALIMGWKFL